MLPVRPPPAPDAPDAPLAPDEPPTPPAPPPEGESQALSKEEREEKVERIAPSWQCRRFTRHVLHLSHACRSSFRRRKFAARNRCPVPTDRPSDLAKQGCPSLPQKMLHAALLPQPARPRRLRRLRALDLPQIRARARRYVRREERTRIAALRRALRANGEGSRAASQHRRGAGGLRAKAERAAASSLAHLTFALHQEGPRRRKLESRFDR